jgi:SAM-dependent methyltransferase
MIGRSEIGSQGVDDAPHGFYAACVPCRFPNEAHVCPSCQSGDLRLLAPLHLNMRGRKVAFASGCNDCGLVFVDPPAPASEIEAYYAEGGAWNRKQSSDRLDKDPTPPRGRALNIAAKATELFPNGGTVLDVGCGAGTLLDVFQKYGWRTTGIDPATASRITRHEMLQEVPEAARFDFVVLRHVLEHLPDPLLMLRKVRACLVEGGYLFIGVPTLDGLEKHRNLRYCLNRFHVTGYTRRSLEALLSRAGFVIACDYPTPRPYRMALLAQTGGSIPRLNEPLRDAAAAFHSYAAATEGRFAARLPIRLRALQMRLLPPPKRSTVGQR